MNDNVTKKILKSHLVSGELSPGEEIEIRIDQTLTHDINAVMSYLAFENLGLDSIGIDLAVSYLDHNLLYLDNKTPDDHIYLQSVAKKYGVHLSRPGNGICHMVHMERFGKPGSISMGGDSHTPHAGAIGMLGIGVGGMDVAKAMTGLPMKITMPKTVKVNLSGRLRAGVNAKEVILEMLRRETIKGGLGRIYEYVGEGIKHLEIPQRSTITNMGAEMGATTSIFPSDNVVKEYLRAQGREDDYVEILPDENANYDEIIEINLSELEPMVALPHQPDNIVKIKDAPKKKIQQVYIGSCTNTSYADVAKAAVVLKGHHVHEDVSATLGVSSKQIYRQLLKDGYIDMLLEAGVRILEIACGPCCAIGQSPATEGVSVRTSNRNFKGRAGNPTAEILLVSPETAAATAIKGELTTAEEIMGDRINELEKIKEPKHYLVDDSMIIKPLDIEDTKEIEIVRGPNIQPLPIPDELEDYLKAKVSLVAKDNVSTDDITPASAEFSSMRSNIPLMSQYCFFRYDPEFANRAKEMGKSIIIGGENYGQGSSREHAAINPMYLGVKVVIAKSIARIHKGNLVNHGIIPLVFADESDYLQFSIGDELQILNLKEQIKSKEVLVQNLSKNTEFKTKLELTDSEIEVVLDSGQLRHLMKKLQR